jgi:hypothetical protein
MTNLIFCNSNQNSRVKKFTNIPPIIDPANIPNGPKGVPIPPPIILPIVDPADDIADV